jgi:DEAD/DEAH box helicase domain-containing protein
VGCKPLKTETELEPALILPAREPEWQEIPRLLDPRVRQALTSNGYVRLYRHQAEAIESLLDGHNVVLATGTGSGKSLVFWSYALHSLVAEPMARVLAIFPTKALAQDQLMQFESWVPSSLARIGILDGDTKKSHRAVIRQSAHVVITNPDTLHLGILPNHPTWAQFFRALRLIVVDEIHGYTGVFGAHVALILRRLLRLAHWHGSRPQIVAASATIADPVTHAKRLTSLPFEAVLHDGSRKFERRIFVMPTADSSLKQTCDWFGRSVLAGYKTLVFSPSRQIAERLTQGTRRLLEHKSESPRLVDTYRAGLSPKERRTIEERFHNGTILGLSATSALELGVDIGNLDRVLLNGYPGQASSFWQQIGRVGRTAKGDAFYLPRLDPLDQSVARNLVDFRDAPIESSPLAMSNVSICRNHLRCAAFERALDPQETAIFGSASSMAVDAMIDAGELVPQADRYYYPSHKNPAPNVSIRGSGGDQVQLLCGMTSLGNLELARAMREVHPGATYLHRGESYHVLSLDLDSLVARLEPDGNAPMTQSKVQHVVSIGAILSERLPLQLASLTTTTWVTGYQIEGKKNQFVKLDLPPQTFPTLGIVITLDERDSLGAVHAAEHGLLTAATLISGCHLGDLASTWTLAGEGQPGMLAIVDAAVGGNGVSEALIEQASKWLKLTIRLLESCSCRDGCRACLLSPRCPYSNEWLDKAGAVHLLRQWTRDCDRLNR